MMFSFVFCGRMRNRNRMSFCTDVNMMMVETELRVNRIARGWL